VAPATLAGIGCALVAVPLPALASLLGWLAGLPAAWLVLVARTGCQLPGAGLAWPTGARGLMLLAGAATALTLTAWGARRWLRRAILGRCPV